VEKIIDESGKNMGSEEKMAKEVSVETEEKSEMPEMVPENAKLVANSDEESEDRVQKPKKPTEIPAKITLAVEIRAAYAINRNLEKTIDDVKKDFVGGEYTKAEAKLLASLEKELASSIEQKKSKEMRLDKIELNKKRKLSDAIEKEKKRDEALLQKVIGMSDEKFEEVKLARASIAGGANDAAASIANKDAAASIDAMGD